MTKKVKKKHLPSSKNSLASSTKFMSRTRNFFKILIFLLIVSLNFSGDATIIEVTGVFSDEVTVFWSFDPEDEPFIQGFILQYREVGVDEWTNSSLILPSSRLFKLTGLGENTLYFLRLIAVDRSANPAAFSFQKPIKTLSRSEYFLSPFHTTLFSGELTAGLFTLYKTCLQRE